MSYEDGTSASVAAEQCNPFLLQSGCILTLERTKVSFKVLATTDLSTQWLNAHNRGGWTFGPNLSWPTEEYLDYRTQTSKKFVPRDNKEYKL